MRGFIALAVLVLLPLVSGCWGRQEIEDFAFVTMAGIDVGQNTGEVLLTVHIAKPSAIAGSGGMAAESRVSVVAATGPTVGVASESLAEMLPRRITCAHSTVIAIGEEYARAGITGLIDFLARAESTRETAVLVVVKGGTASDLMNAEHGLEQMPSAALLGLIHNAAYVTSTSVISTVNDLLRMLGTPGVDVTIAGIQVRPLQAATEPPTDSPDMAEPSTDPTSELEPPSNAQGMSEPSAGSPGAPEQPIVSPGLLERASLSSLVEMSGIAVFRGDSLVGWLDQEQSRGFRWLRGDVADAVVLLTNPADSRATVSIRARSARTHVSTSMADGRPVVSVRAEIVASIGDSEVPPSSDDPENTRSLKTALESVIQSEVAAMVDQAARKLQSDIFGFGTALYRAGPREWNQLEGQWSDLLQQTELSIDVQAKLPQTGLSIWGD